MSGTRASRRRVKRSVNCKETPPVRAGFFMVSSWEGESFMFHMFRKLETWDLRLET
jgi:hypothetical protein